MIVYVYIYINLNMIIHIYMIIYVYDYIYIWLYIYMIIYIWLYMYILLMTHFFCFASDSGPGLSLQHWWQRCSWRRLDSAWRLPWRAAGIGHKPRIFNWHPRVSFSGWWFQPLGKIWKSVGMIIPNIWENKIHVPNHQPVFQGASESHQRRLCHQDGKRTLQKAHLNCSHTWICLRTPLEINTYAQNSLPSRSGFPIGKISQITIKEIRFLVIKISLLGVFQHGPFFFWYTQR